MAQPATETPPSPVVMMQLLFGKQLTYSLSAVARLGVTDHMDAAAKPVEEIAAKAGAHAPSLYRIMRMFASLGVFKEGPPRHFALTPVAERVESEPGCGYPYSGFRVARLCISFAHRERFYRRARQGNTGTAA